MDVVSHHTQINGLTSPVRDTEQFLSSLTFLTRSLSLTHSKLVQFMITRPFRFYIEIKHLYDQNQNDRYLKFTSDIRLQL